MTSWLTPNTPVTPDPAAIFSAQADRQLRAMDIALAALALLLLAVPLSAGLLLGRLRAVNFKGRNHQTFKRWQIEFPQGVIGRQLDKTGLGRCPVLLNVLNGDMAWVGPRPIAAGSGSDYHPALAQLRPGLVNIWQLRRRTAVDFGSELDADLEYQMARGLKHDLGLLLRSLLVSWLPLPRETPPGRLCVGDVSFDNLTMPQAVTRIGAMLDHDTVQQVSFVNPACVNIAAGDRGYRRILSRAALVLPDGIGIKIAARLLAVPLQQNVNGTDLFPRLCAMLESRGASLFLLGGKPGVAERVAAVIHQRWPGLRIAGLRDGYFEVAQEGEVAAEVRASQADILLVARGVPMQDVFIDRHLHQLGVKVAIGVGGLFDFVSGRIHRAPAWMRDSGLEWIYRLMQEPARMWRRYLLGNFTFLGRILLQRVGLRRPANDALNNDRQVSAATAANVAGLRVVLFAAACAPPDIPVAHDFPAALLPFGCSTFIEQNLEQLSNAGVRQIDLVVSARPEELRQRLGAGERWGIELRWHLAKDPRAPYGLLRSLGLKHSDRVLLGHADRWIADHALTSLMAQNLSTARASDPEGLRWLGWSTTRTAALESISPHCDESALGAILCGPDSRLLMLEPDQCVGVASALQLLQAQASAMKAGTSLNVPATWLRTAWGAHSPEAVLQAGAMIEGPALIGPGCLVAAGARIGPGTSLTRNVVVSQGSSICNSVVLPHTFIGHGLELTDTIVNARSVQHLRLGVRTVLPLSEGLLLNLKNSRPATVSWLTRGTAAVACLALLPSLAIDTGIRRLRGLPLRWKKRLVALGRDADSGEVRLQSLRCARLDQRGPGRLLANYGAWLDVLAGRRSWFGARPRSLSEWYALGRDWQTLLTSTPVGCVHAPAWSDGAGESLEARAAADVFFAVDQRLLKRTRLFFAILKAIRSGSLQPA
ncbi:MAG: WecB/TagA/CpsF family glycosyltransferase [Rhodoferax sp.]